MKFYAKDNANDANGCGSGAYVCIKLQREKNCKNYANRLHRT